MSYYILRIDDACEKRDIQKWDRMEFLLDRYGIRPLVGVIPHCEDPAMDIYAADPEFWGRVDAWVQKGWTIAMHGYNHVYSTNSGGINPVNKRSEFAGEPLEIQKEKIVKGVAVLREHGIDPQIFFAPSHTFDKNTIEALKTSSNIRTISDTIAFNTYYFNEILFIPQQSGRVRKLPFPLVTFCYHPNTMRHADYGRLEQFLHSYGGCFVSTEFFMGNKRKQTLVDGILRKFYFLIR
ncbi:MAG: DUF2334 domain-containing protein [Syntrophomonas sp.]